MHLEKLASVVEALQLADTDNLPEGYGKQLRLFKLMHDVACRFVDVKNKERGQGSSQQNRTDGNLDVFLHDTRLTSPMARTTHHGQFGQGNFESGGFGEMSDIGDLFSQMGSQGGELGSWFDQNQHMMRLMEDHF